MKYRRVVTGQNADGKRIIASDTLVDGIEVGLMPGAEFHSLWSSEKTPVVPNDGSEFPFNSWFAPAGGFHFVMNMIPPEAPSPEMSSMSEEEINAMMAARIADTESKMPGLIATMEPDMSGFHTSDTVDLLYIISGEIVLDLGEGETVALKAGDSIIQNGTRHTWRNLGTEPCIFLAVIIGARRQGS